MPHAPCPVPRSLFPVLLAVALVALLVACGGSVSTTTSGTSGDPDTTVAIQADDLVSTTLLPSVTATTPLDVVAVFLAVVDEAMADTEFAEYGFDAPEDVLLLGQVFCEMRDTGYADEESLAIHLENLAEIREVTEEDARFAGTVMGAAFATLCPSTD